MGVGAGGAVLVVLGGGLGVTADSAAPEEVRVEEEGMEVAVAMAKPRLLAICTRGRNMVSEALMLSRTSCYRNGKPRHSFASSSSRSMRLPRSHNAAAAAVCYIVQRRWSCPATKVL